MGFLSKLFKKETKQETKIEQEIKENIEKGADYSCALQEQILKCSGCGQDIEGTPRIRNYNGKRMYFHKRCWKAMCNGKLPKPKEMQEDETGKN